MRFDVHRWWARRQFTDTARVRLYRKIAKMLGNGLPLLRVLEELRERASHHGRKPNEPLAIVLDDCRRLVQNGRTLPEGLEGWAPRTERMILLAGAQSGHMEAALLSVIEVVQAQRKIKAVILGGIAYPGAVLLLILVYIYLFGTRVIPEFTRIVDPAGWHGAARSLYLMSLLVQDWMAYVVVALALALTGLALALPRWRGDLRILLDRYAPFSIYRLVVGSGFLLAFSALQSAGVTVEKSLTRLSGMADPWLRERLDGALLGVRSGLNCGEALRNAGYGFPSAEVIDDLCVYAEYRGFGEALKLMADEWLEEGIEQISAQMKILNGVAIITMSVVIGWLVTGFFGIQQEIATMTRAIH
ncbi:type II secretion system F family protein [Duganella radicis]|uniref:Type II secretion system protein F n=1 Tax=Duganella radicis TaxID=551988 RepID=A0A6L6PRG4_9BURK|nr:type II secretion system protein F [Duganella radicis]